jgi:hypothetical protein
MTSIFSRRLTVLLPILAGAGACERSEPGATPSAGRDGPGNSPRAVIEQLIALRDRAAYQRLGELIVPEGGRRVVDLLMAVDDFLNANAALCGYVQREFTVGLSQSIDQSYWGGVLGVFSAHVELIDQHVDGDKASVAFLINGQLPLQRAELRLLDGGWRYDPGPGYDQRLVEAFGEMARGLRRVLADLNEGRLSATAIHADPQRLLEEVRLRLSRGIALLPPPPASRPTADSAFSSPNEGP